MCLPGWQDREPPKETAGVRKLLRVLEKSCTMEKEYAQPAIIHCNSGSHTIAHSLAPAMQAGKV